MEGLRYMVREYDRERTEHKISLNVKHGHILTMQ
jgi:hypothetical protein